MKLFGKTIIAALMAAVCVSVFGSCFAGKDAREASGSIKETRRVEYFSKVEIASAVDVKFVQGKSCSMRVEGPQRLVDNLVVKQSGDRLTLTYKPGLRFNFSSGSLTVYLTSPDLTEVSIAGSGEFLARGVVDTDNLSVRVSGSGEVSLPRVVCDNAYFDLRGSGDVRAQSVECRSASVSLAGSGDVTLRSLKADKADIAVRGSGDVDAWLKSVASTRISVVGSGDVDVNFDNCGKADCTVAGSGDVELSGTLGQLSRSASGSGEIDTAKLMLKQ